MTGPLDVLFAQVRDITARIIEAINADDFIEAEKLSLEFDVTLSSIERHVQNMEKAIWEWAYDQGYDSLSVDSILIDIRERAALPAREKEEE